VVQWAWQHGCSWDTEACAAGRSRRAPGGVAVGAGARLRVEQEDDHSRRAGRAPGGVEIGAGARLPCPWDEETYAAAFGGHLDVLNWALEHGWPWDQTTCATAAEGGQQEVLKWARQHDCPWDQRTCEAAIQAGTVLQWARDHGCLG